jgi:hypothetical protein
VERNLRLEVDIISGRREDAFHFLNYKSICFRSSREEKVAVFEWIEFIDINRQVFSIIFNDFFFFFYLRGVYGPAYAHHDYSSRPTGHSASPGAGKAPRG